MNTLLVGPRPLSDSERCAVKGAEWDYVVAVDGGLSRCAELSLAPSVLIGDLDSLPADTVIGELQCPVERHFVEKDYSDLDAVVQHLEDRGADTVVAVGLSGGRLDHQLTVIRSLFNLSAQTVTLYGEGQYVQLVSGAGSVDVPATRTFSVLAFEGPARVSVTGAQWNLDEVTLEPLSTHGLSNVAGPSGAHVTTHQGQRVIVVVQQDDCR